MLDRSGSYILVHGGCSSVGCFAMTDAVIAEIYKLTEAALRAGQERVDVHVFPFRMTDENLARKITTTTGRISGVISKKATTVSSGHDGRRWFPFASGVISSATAAPGRWPVEAL